MTPHKLPLLNSPSHSRDGLLLRRTIMLAIKQHDVNVRTPETLSSKSGGAGQLVSMFGNNCREAMLKSGKYNDRCVSRGDPSKSFFDSFSSRASTRGSMRSNISSQSRRQTCSQAESIKLPPLHANNGATINSKCDRWQWPDTEQQVKWKQATPPTSS